MECLRELEKRLGIKPVNFGPIEENNVQDTQEEKKFEKPYYKDVTQLKTRNLSKKYGISEKDVKTIFEQALNLDTRGDSVRGRTKEDFLKNFFDGAYSCGELSQHIDYINRLWKRG